MMEESLFLNKDQVTFFVPVNITDDERDMFLIELVECLEAYLWPIARGFWANDFIDFIRSDEHDISSFLQTRRYIVSEPEFMLLARKYACDSLCHKLVLTRCGELHEKDLHHLVITILNQLLSGAPLEIPNCQTEVIRIDN